MNERLDFLKDKALHLPGAAGVYLMKNADGIIIYIGKAKSLKNRVTSYFTSIWAHNDKTRALVEVINDFDIIRVGSEFEALLLEASLIKKHTPKYNILLKDDKGYPFIRIDVREDIPKFTIAGKRINDGARYFGPYGSRYEAGNIIYALGGAFKLADCNGKFKKDKSGKTLVGGKPCLNLHIGRCVGVCGGKITIGQYKNLVDSAISVLDGRIDSVYDEFEEKMNAAAEAMQYERAADYRDILRALKKIKEKQKIIGNSRMSADAVVTLYKERLLCITVISVRNGTVCGSYSNVEKIENEEEIPGVLTEYLCRFYEIAEIPQALYMYESTEDDELFIRYLNHISEDRGKKIGVRLISPKTKGVGTGLLDLAAVNCNEFLLEYQGRTDKVGRRLSAFADLAGLSDVPVKIEMFDVSHTAGSNTVCGMIVFSEGGFDKKQYRLFTVEDANKDDIYAMTDAVHRRIMRTVGGDPAFGELPDVIVADGGQTQTFAVQKTVAGLKQQYGFKDIAVVGLKKDSSHRTKSVVLADGGEKMLRSDPLAMMFASSLQNEVHRFAVKAHAGKRSAKMKSLQLTNIPGVGKKRAALLLSHFKTIKKIKEATPEELTEAHGISLDIAKKIYEYYLQ